MATFTSGHYDLQSTSILAQHTGDRPSFQADVSRGLFNSGHFQVFAMPQGLLFLEMRLRDYGNMGPDAPCGGGLAGAAAAWQEGERYGFAPPDKWETGLDAKGEDELLELARERGKSFVSKLDEIRSVSIDAPGFFGMMFGDSTLQGTITLRDRKLGKVLIDIRDASAMSVAVDALPRRLGDRVTLNAQFDQKSRRFVPR
jgi:hypothetical protein